MARRRNPSTLTWVLLAAGAAGAGYFFLRRRDAPERPMEVTPSPPPAVHDAPAADQPPSLEECPMQPAPIVGYEWICRGGVWKKRRTARTRRTPPQQRVVGRLVT